MGRVPPISEQVRTGNESRAAAREATEIVSDNCPELSKIPSRGSPVAFPRM